MSERSQYNISEFERDWPVHASPNEHSRYVAEGIQRIESQLILPGDDRWETAYGALAMGGAEASVLTEGDPGSGKTAFGNIVLGEVVRVDVASTDVAETLDGYIRPTDGKFNPGKLQLDEAQKIYLNEISHLRDTGPLHKYWDGKTASTNGSSHDLENVAIYATTNFADGKRAKFIDSALRSRFGITVLAGDNAGEVARALQGQDIADTRKAEATKGGLLPPTKARKAIRETLETRHRLSRQAKEYITDTIENINDTELLLPISLSDRRISQGWQQAVRANRLVEGGIENVTPIKPEDLAKVAALSLGGLTSLNNATRSELQEQLGTMKLSSIEQAIIVRRAISAVAFRSVLQQKDFVKQGEDERIGHFMDNYAYAQAPNGRINDVVVSQLDKGGSVNTQKAGDHGKKSRVFGRRSK